MGYRFGEFVVDTVSYTLSRAGRDVPVRPKVFDLLRHLIAHRDRVVTKQELLETLWPEQHVDEFVVPWTVSHTRRALGQDTGAQQPIQTVRGRGYRFVADVVELGAESPPLRAARRAQLPEPHPFVGREHLMEQLQARLLRAKEGAGSFCLLVGEAGIGKTRCLEELAARAEALDFAVWAGRSVEATCGPVFWPWIQILRALVKDHPALAEPGEATIARLMTYPELAAPEPAAEAPALAMASDRFWQYEAVASLLQQAARVRPLLLTFDDLHWADSGSWELLGFLGPELRRLPVLIAGARRDDRHASGRDRPAQQARDATRFKLPGLSTSDVERYLQLLTGLPEPNPALCEAVQRASAGNPWFLGETIDALLAEHGREALATLEASAVRPAGAALDRLRARIAALAPQVQLVLRRASVLGERFEPQLVARMGELADAHESASEQSAAQAQVEAALSALEAARAADLVSLDDPPQRARFAHGLLRSVLYEELPLPERLRLHLAAARALEQTLEPLRYAEIAHHYHCALPLAQPGTALQAAVRAANAAARAHAFRDSALFLEWASDAQLNDPGAPARARAELALQRAIAERLAGREALARNSAASVLELARVHGYGDLAVQAVRVLRVSFALGCMPDALALEALSSVLASAPPGACEERVSALSMLSWIPPHALDMQRSKALSAEALGLARELGTPNALQQALHARLYALSGPDDIDALLAAADALLAVPGERLPWLEVEASLASFRAHLYRCDLVAADAALNALGKTAREHGLAEVAWHHGFFEAQRTFTAGDLARSDALFTELSARGARLQLTQEPMLSAVARALLTYEREGPQALAQAANLDALLAGLLALPPSFGAAGARLAAELGRPELARQALHQIAQQDFQAIVRDLGYVNALTNLSVVAIALGERSHARAIYERLVPYAHHNTPAGAIGFPEGSASRFLACLAAFLGEQSHVERHFEEALALNERIGYLPQVAHTCCEYARWLVQQRRKAAAAAFKERAFTLAGELGMQGVSASARAL